AAGYGRRSHRTSRLRPERQRVREPVAVGVLGLPTQRAVALLPQRLQAVVAAVAALLEGGEDAVAVGVRRLVRLAAGVEVEGDQDLPRVHRLELRDARRKVRLQVGDLGAGELRRG